ncbi:hypothetical protein HYPSUDRAFT_54174 [Hypholoma sublateritium FD-334 SS-4]|uniref:Uncharacterized protein n=1 Tax=Hypholoma sublateritium (strain FD-334 SS-4) TaxID=945553 RepID=A0A0D2MJ96_HYPSF|nr:hypothetical protein HYPSUDRAFT_54174 [Hypholoma sublateritium FD-334 SS-4]
MQEPNYLEQLLELRDNMGWRSFLFTMTDFCGGLDKVTQLQCDWGGQEEAELAQQSGSSTLVGHSCQGVKATLFCSRIFLEILIFLLFSGRVFGLGRYGWSWIMVDDHGVCDFNATTGRGSKQTRRLGVVKDTWFGTADLKYGRTGGFRLFVGRCKNHLKNLRRSRALRTVGKSWCPLEFRLCRRRSQEQAMSPLTGEQRMAGEVKTEFSWGLGWVSGTRSLRGAMNEISESIAM